MKGKNGLCPEGAGTIRSHTHEPVCEKQFFYPGISSGNKYFPGPGKKKLGMVHFTIKVADSMGGKTPIDWEEDDLQAGPADAAIKIGP